jgi:hypothetical protein
MIGKHPHYVVQTFVLFHVGKEKKSTGEGLAVRSEMALFRMVRKTSRKLGVGRSGTVWALIML